MRVLLFLCCLFFCGCNSSGQKIKIAATTVPHAEILEVVKEELKSQGIELKIIEIDDYNLPNRMLSEGQVDANFFQHKPFLDEQIRLYGYKLTPLTAVHIEPLGIYSTVYKTLDDVVNKASVAIPQDPTNESRALLLLEKIGLIKLKENGTSKNLLTIHDVVENSKNLRIVELDAPFLPRALSDVDLAVIPSNFALQAKLNPKEDALALESSDSPYANIVVVRTQDIDRKEFAKLKEALQSEKVRNFILEKYKGAILPVQS